MSTESIASFLVRWEKIHDHVDPDHRLMILRDFCDLIRKGTVTVVSAPDQKKISSLLAMRFTGMECIKDVQSEAVRTLEAFMPLANSESVLHFCREFVAGALTPKGTYIKDRLVRVEHVPLLRENGCLGLRMALRRLISLSEEGKVQEGDESTFVNTIIPPFVAAIANKDAEEPTKRDYYELLQPLLTSLPSYVTARQTESIYRQLRADWGCNTDHLFNQLIVVNASLFPLLSEDLFKEALDTLLKDLNTTRGESFRRNLNAFIAVIRTSSSRVGDKVPQLYSILYSELSRLTTDSTNGTGEETENDDARASILDSLRVLARDCPKETEPFLSEAVRVAIESLTWDPNYCGDDEATAADDGDDNATDAYGGYGDDGGEGGYGDEYADYYASGEGYGYDVDNQQNADDSSWKVRLSAAALLSTILRSSYSRSTAESTFKKLLDDGTNSSPLLIKRLKDRVEAVKLEIHDLFHASLELASTERANTLTSFTGNAQATNVSIAYGRETSASLVPLPLASLFDASQSTIISTLCSFVSSDSKASSAKVSPKAVEALRRFVLVRDAKVLNSVPAIVEAVKPLAAEENARRSAAATLPAIFHLLRFLLIRGARTDVEATASAGAAAVLSMLPAVAEACKDKTPSVARAAIELASEMAVISSSAAPIVFAAVSSLFDTPDTEVKTAAIAAVAKVATAPGANLALTSLEPAFTSLANLLDFDPTRRVAANTVRLLARTSLPKNFVSVFADRLVKSLNRADRQEREATICALEALVARHPAAVPASAYAVMVSALSESPLTSSLILEKELTISTVSLQLLGAIAASGMGGNLSVVVNRVLEFLAKPNVQGLPIFEAGKAMFAIGKNAEAVAGGYESLASTVQSAFTADTVGSVSASLGAVVAADAKPERQQRAVANLAASITDPSVGPRAASALGELGRFVDITTFGAAVSALTAVSFRTEEIAVAATNALAKSSASPVGKNALALLLSIGVDGKNYVATRALRASFADGALAPDQHPLSDTAVFSEVLDKLTSDAVLGASSDIPEVHEALGQMAAWNALKAFASITQLVDSGSESKVAAAAYALRFALRAAPQLEASDVCVRLFSNFNRPDKVAIRRNCLMLLRALLADGLYTQAIHSAAFSAAVTELTVDVSLVRLTDLGIVKHREDRGVDLRRNAFDFVRELLQSPESSLLSGSDYAAVANATMAALGPVAGIQSEDDEDIIADARRQLIRLSRSPAAWSVIASTDGMNVVAKYMASSLKLKEKDGVVDKKEEDNVILALAVLYFLKTNVLADKLAPLSEKIKEAETNTRAVRGKLLLSELLKSNETS